MTLNLSHQIAIAQMSTLQEAEEHYARIYEAIQQIPRGSVTTYGAIAALIGKPRNARQVGFALKGLPNEHMSNSSVSRSTNMALQFDPRDGFLDERMFIGSRDDDDSSDEEDSGGDRQATPPRFHTGNVPWWRVIGSGGVVPVRARPEQRDNHARRLLEEGVECDGYRVDMRLYEWVPQANLFANADHGE